MVVLAHALREWRPSRPCRFPAEFGAAVATAIIGICLSGGRSLLRCERAGGGSGRAILEEPGRRPAPGEMGLAVLAMLKADVPATDPTLAGLPGQAPPAIHQRGVPRRAGGRDRHLRGRRGRDGTGEPRCRVAADRASPRWPQYLTSRQKANGSWDYDNRTVRRHLDLAVRRPRALGGRATRAPTCRPASSTAPRAGSSRPRRPTAAGATMPTSRSSSTITMTAAGVGSLLICQRQLAQYREYSRGEAPSKLLIAARGRAARGRTTRSSQHLGADRAGGEARAGLAGAQLHHRRAEPIIGPYDLLRPLRHRADRRPGRPRHPGPDRLVRAGPAVHPLEPAGGRLLELDARRRGEHRLGDPLPDPVDGQVAPTDRDQAAGRGDAARGPGAAQGPVEPDGRRRAGREPADERRGRGDARRARGPPPENADSALAGLLARYQAGGPAVLRPHKDRFRKLLADRDPGLRQVAGLGPGPDRRPRRRARPDRRPGRWRSETWSTPPARACNCSAARSTAWARPQRSTPEQREEAARRWRDWYNRIRPLDLEGQDERPDAAGPGVSVRRPR